VPGLGTSFGRGGATTAQQDLANADAILIMGSSMAENHPVGFQWVIEARERGGKILHVDPRFTRTSAMADIWLPLRAGSDILFLGAMINYAIENEKYFREYVVRYTNAPMILREDFRDTEDLDGVFSGWDADKEKYSPETWLYANELHSETGGEPAGHAAPGGGHGKDRGGEAGDVGKFEKDETLQNPRCVFQVLKRHFARYTPELVEQFCGIPKAAFLRAAETFCNASGPEKTAAICYAVGWTQHSKGVQIIRSAAILQLLLGNIGRPGGGILALRGHASIQGSTDIPTLYDILPGYLPMPFVGGDSKTLDTYLKKHSSRTGVWTNFDAYAISLLRAWYGDAATKENEWGFQWLPRVSGDHSEFGYWLNMKDGLMEGLFVMGQNPAVGAPNARLERMALSKLKWLVVRDMVETETAAFWYASPEVERGELNPKDIPTEVFLMPAAGSAEKDGSYTNTQRLVQFHNKAVEPAGDARSETWFMYHLGRRLKEKAARQRIPRNEPINNLTWNYGTHGLRNEPNVQEIVHEINGYTVADRELVENFHSLRNDGSTACGCWIYSGIMPHENENKASKREPNGPYGHGWGFAWPNDTRILYNRASARPDGKPWSERKKLVWWDQAKGQWTGFDTPDYQKDVAPDRPANIQHGHGTEALGGSNPFIMHPDGVGWLYVTSGLKDGPLPTHYEPLESLFKHPLYESVQHNPSAQKKERPDNPYAFSPDDKRFPFILTTYRLTEHHTAGGMTRGLSHLAELQPELFCEISPELAEERGIEHGSFCTIMTARGIVQARAMITPRMRPLNIDGRVVHQIGLPYHWGYMGTAKGDVVNDLLAISEEPNVRIMETKSLVCDIQPGRRERGAGAIDQLNAHMRETA
jgi:formate dehydrogenase major subunit